MDLQQYLADISLKTMSQLHRAIIHLSGGQVPGPAFGVPVAGLHAVGPHVGPAALDHSHRAGHRGGPGGAGGPPRAAMTATRTGTAT
jgi:hypothetical protein